MGQTVDASQLGGIRISWRDLESKIVHGVEKVVKVVVNTAENVITHVINTVDNVYNLVVDSIEAAAAAVGSILKTIANAIKSAVQWLSYLFQWSDIQDTKRFIVNQVKGQATNFSTWITNKVNAGTQDIHSYFQSEITAIKGHVQSIAGQQPATMQSQQINNNSPSNTYGHGGGSSSAQTNWMSSKIKGNVGKGINSTSSALLTDTDLDSTIGGLFDLITTSLQDPIFSTFGDDVKNLFSQFADIIKDPTQFVAGSMGAILNIFADIVGIILTLVDDVIEDLMKAIPTLINAAINAVTAPINIPVLSEIWNIISGDPMTILDVFALVIAIPSTIISKIANGVGSTVGGSGLPILGYTQVFAGAIYAIFDAINDGINFTDFSPEAKIGLAMSVITFFLGFPNDISTNSGFTYGFYALAALPIITASISGRGNSYGEGAPPWVAIWSVAQRFFNFLYGAMMIAFSSALAAEIPANWSGLTLAQNLFTYVVYMPKAFAVGPSGCPARLVAAVVDGVCDLTAAGLGAAITWGA